MHLLVDALGLPLVFEITEGQRRDIQPAKEMFFKAASRCLLADKAYDFCAQGDRLLWREPGSTRHLVLRRTSDPSAPLPGTDLDIPR